jgi:16S rRNA (guanine(966)-N(2))-methyltransferase RsmD
VRIISGSAKGMRLNSPPDMTTRPMTDMAKEALFNILADEVVETEVLDLFAGSGALGLEALSRGARFCHFVEQNRQVVKVLQSNIAKARFVEQAHVWCHDVFKILAVLPETRFTLCFFDAPYTYMDNPVNRTRCLEFLHALAGNHLAAHSSLILHYRPCVMAGVALPAGLQVADRRVYGGSELLFVSKTL